ncbi:hypothetical protein E4K72_14205 [Oxalobacteraceae bacterium OM1]|nr:hypothetical protein E4K72_14205 [Oxalobacteraceae bacterium OM1]
MKMTAVMSALLALGFSASACAEILSANGMAEVSVKASGDLVTARRLVREEAEKNAVAQILKIKLSANPSDPKVRGALADLRTQLLDNLKTSFNAEGDALTAKTALQVDAAQFMDLAKSLGITSRAASASAKVLFLIDEYYGVGTKLDPSAPLVTEIDYSHDKSAFSDRSASASGSRSASSSSASASKASYSAASSEKAAFAASSSSSVAARDQAAYSASDKAAFAGSDRRAAGYQDGAGGSAAAARNTQVAGARETQVAGARDSQYAASQKSAAAGSYSAQYAVAASSEQAAASKSASASSYATQQKDIQRQNDVVNLKVRQVFPGIDNAKPADDASALINQKLQQVVKEFGLVYTDEKDFRYEGGRKLTVSDIGKLQKFDAYLRKAAQGNYKAKYLVYGTAVMQSEGQTPSGQVQCAGQLALSSSDVDTGEGFMSGTITKRAVGSSDQNCRSNLSEALARTLADTVGTAAQRELQQAATQGRTYTLALYSALRVPSRLRREFSAKVKALDGVVEINDDGNATEEMRSWTVVAKGNFAEKIDDLIDDIVESDNSAYKAARFEKHGNRMVFCVEGKCPQEF